LTSQQATLFYIVSITLCEFLELSVVMPVGGWKMRMKKLWIAALFLAIGGSVVEAQTDGAEPIEIPLRFEGGHLIVPVEASDGTQLEFIVSTGSGATVLSESTAALLGDHAILTLGGVPVPTEETHTTSDESLTTDGKSADGMIGSNTLNQFDVLVDVPGQRLVLKPIGRSVEWEGMTLSDPVRVRVMHGLLIALDVELNGSAYKGMLDLGMPSLLVNEPVKTAAGIDDDDVVTLGLGVVTLPDLPVEVSDHPLFAAWDAGNNGFVVVGAAMVKNCALSISWVHREIRTCVR